MAIRNFTEGTSAVVLKSATVLLATVFLVCPPPASGQDIYKTVDENGNTVYTDQKPSDDAKPVKLKELTVVDPLEFGGGRTGAAAGGNATSGDSGADSAPAFDLAIATPGDGETVWNTAYELAVQVRAGRELPPGARLAYVVDGEVRLTTRALNVEIDGVYRGEHELSVELRSSDGRVLGSAGPVTFFMRQHSRLHPNPG